MIHYKFLRAGEDILNKEGTKVVNFKEVHLIASTVEEAIEKVTKKNHGHYVIVDSWPLNKDWT